MTIEQALPVQAHPAEDPPPLPKPKLPGLHEVIAQVESDLFKSKDVQDTATFSYQWTADQFGHFALGFEITFALSWVAALLGYAGGRVGFWIGLAVVLIFVLKEANDFRIEWRKACDAKSVFKFNSLEIFSNTFTAVFYIALGGIVAAFGLLAPGYGLISIPVTAVFALGLGYVWLRKKITFQQAGLPYLYRLANFPSPIPKASAQFIVNLSKPSAPDTPPTIADHLIIAGPLDSGKSSLAVGIGTEFAFRMGIARYTTLSKLLQAALKDGQWDKPEFDDGRILWPWQTSDLLIVDDVDVISDHVPGTSMAVETERQIVQSRVNTLKSQIPPVLQDALKYRRTVWVVGDINDGELLRWQKLIADMIETSLDRVQTVLLKQKVYELDPNRPSPSKEEQIQQ